MEDLANVDITEAGKKVIVVAPQGFIYYGVIGDNTLPGHLRIDNPYQILSWSGDKGLASVANGDETPVIAKSGEWVELPELAYRLVLDGSKMRV